MDESTKTPKSKRAKRAIVTRPRSLLILDKRATATPTKKKGKRGARSNAIGQHHDGHYFQSKAELARYEQLKELAEQGVIERLELQVPYPIHINNKKICEYRADFRYAVVDDLGRVLRWVVEDVKGWKTDVYAIKKKLVEASYGLTLSEIPAGKIAEWAGKTA